MENINAKKAAFKTFVTRNALGLTTTALVVAGTAGAQTSSTLIGAPDMTSAKSDWIGGITPAIPVLLGMYGIKIAADFVMRRFGRAGK